MRNLYIFVWNIRPYTCLSLQFTEHFFSVSVEDNAAISALAPVLGISLLFNLIVIISLILAFSSQQQSDSFRREVKNKERFDILLWKFIHITYRTLTKISHQTWVRNWDFWKDLRIHYWGQGNVTCLEKNWYTSVLG